MGTPYKMKKSPINKGYAAKPSPTKFIVSGTLGLLAGLKALGAGAAATTAAGAAGAAGAGAAAAPVATGFMAGVKTAIGGAASKGLAATLGKAAVGGAATGIDKISRSAVAKGKQAKIEKQQAIRERKKEGVEAASQAMDKKIKTKNRI